MTTRPSAQRWAVLTANPTNYGEGKHLYRSSIPSVPKRNHRRTHGDNSHVSNILPLTTFRTIDLGGREFCGPLFSRFCAEMRVFFDENPAPKCVQKGQASSLEVTLGLEPARRRLRQFGRRFERITLFSPPYTRTGPPCSCAKMSQPARIFISPGERPSPKNGREPGGTGLLGCRPWHSGLHPFRKERGKGWGTPVYL